MKIALIIIDIQNDYFPGGRMELVGAEAAGQRAKEALAFFRGHNLPVIHIRHLSTRPTATFFLPLKVRALSWTEHYIRRKRGELEFWRKRKAKGTF